MCVLGNRGCGMYLASGNKERSTIPQMRSDRHKDRDRSARVGMTQGPLLVKEQSHFLSGRRTRPTYGQYPLRVAHRWLGCCGTMVSRTKGMLTWVGRRMSIQSDWSSSLTQSLEQVSRRSPNPSIYGTVLPSNRLSSTQYLRRTEAEDWTQCHVTGY